MPLYEYQCESCDERFEVLQRLGEGAQSLVCPGCGDSKLKKQFSTFASGGSDGAIGSFSPPSSGCGGGGSGFG